MCRDLALVQVLVETCLGHQPRHLGNFVSRLLPRGSVHGNHVVGCIQVDAVKSSCNLKVELTKWDHTPAYFNVKIEDLSFLAQAHAWAMSYPLAEGVTELDADDPFVLQHTGKERQLRTIFTEAFRRRVDYQLSQFATAA